MPKKPFYYFRYGFIALFSLLSVISLIAFANEWTFAPHTVENTGKFSGEYVPDTSKPNAVKYQRPIVAYAVSNGWHTGVIVPAWRINALLPGIKARFVKSNASSDNEPSYYEIGWGDQGFYEAKEITTWMAVQALFNSPGSVMHVVAVNNPQKEFANIQLVKFCLDDAQLVSLEKYIVSSFAVNSNGQIISRRPGLYGDSQFYEGAGTYHFLNSCNTWAAKALRSAGFDISPTFKLFARQVMNNMDVSDAAACQVAM
jgi:uncharacterized protein (TIGR02117 family)